MINRSNKSSAETLLHTHKNNSSKSIKQYLREFLRSKPLKINKKTRNTTKKESISRRHESHNRNIPTGTDCKKRKKEEFLFLLAFAISI